MAYGDAQTLRWVFPAPLRDARLPLQRSQLLRVPVRHGLKFWSLRPHVSTARCSQFLPRWRGTCRTQHQRSLDHRALRGPTRNAILSHFGCKVPARCRCMTSVRDGRELHDRRRRPRRPFVGTPPRQPRPRGAWDTSGQAPGPGMSTMN